MAIVRLGYLISQYPAVNHTFILREVLGLRREGFDVRTASIRISDRPPEALSRDEALEHSRTFSVVGAGAKHALAANLRVFTRRPWAYLRGLFFAWKLSAGAPRRIVSYTLYFLEAIVAGEYFRREGVDFIHGHFSSTVLLIMARIFPIRYSITLHGPSEFADVIGFHIAEKVRAAEFVVAISHYGASQVMSASDPSDWSKVLAVPLGVDPEKFPPVASRPRSSGDAFRLIFVGRLAPVKAQHMLVEAVHALRARGRNVELVLVGEGPSRSSLERSIAALGLQNVVRLAGACNHDRIADFYRQSDAFALASFAEGVPVVLMEAMAMELPCVATWITGIPELIQADLEGLLVPPASPEAIATAVERLMDEPALARRLGVAGRQKVLRDYHLDRNVDRLGKVFQSRLTGTPLR